MLNYIGKLYTLRPKEMVVIDGELYDISLIPNRDIDVIVRRADALQNESQYSDMICPCVDVSTIVKTYLSHVRCSACHMMVDATKVTEGVCIRCDFIKLIYLMVPNMVNDLYVDISSNDMIDGSIAYRKIVAIMKSVDIHDVFPFRNGVGGVCFHNTFAGRDRFDAFVGNCSYSLKLEYCYDEYYSIFLECCCNLRFT